MKLIIKIKDDAERKRLKEFIDTLRNVTHNNFDDVVEHISLDEMNIFDLEFEDTIIT
ncbi:hypothetical protein KAU33_08735 [Candidatus Dependentiae bacterium]|nr:hypothetical protein [Candidatus Dependentiae bacterium]